MDRYIVVEQYDVAFRPRSADGGIVAASKPQVYLAANRTNPLHPLQTLGRLVGAAVVEYDDFNVSKNSVLPERSQKQLRQFPTVPAKDDDGGETSVHTVSHSQSCLADAPALHSGVFVMTIDGRPEREGSAKTSSRT